jgi:hypothetical protein
VGGPSFFIHLPRPLSADAIEQLDARVRREMHHVTRARSTFERLPGVHHLSCGICLLEPEALERWCGHPEFYLEV